MSSKASKQQEGRTGTVAGRTESGSKEDSAIDREQMASTYIWLAQTRNIRGGRDK